MLLLDIDADFMLSEDGCNANAHCDSKDRIRLRVSGKRLAEAIKPFIGPNTRFVPVVDHQESLYVWDVMGVRNAKCIHIDAHHDCWASYSYPIRGVRTRDIGCGNYLIQAMCDKVVDHTTYVPALFRSVEYEKEDVSYELSGIVSPRRLEVQSWCKFTKQAKKTKEKASIVTIAVSPEWFPKQFAHAYRELCQHLNIKKKLVDVTLCRANKKWAHIKRTGIVGGFSVESLDFTFPYNSRRVLRGQRLTQLAGRVRRNSQVRGKHA